MLRSSRPPRPRRQATWGLVCALLVTAGCADFSEQDQRGAVWSEPRTPTPVQPTPFDATPERQQRDQPDESTPVPPPEGCVDHHVAVVATCLDPVAGIAVLPDGEHALVGEATTGRIVRVAIQDDPERKDRYEEFATVDVDPSGGGLLGLALSPNYLEDELVYAYVSTPEDNRVVRVARGDSPKPVLTGIPRGGPETGGALALDPAGALLVATGAASDAEARDPGSPGGKLLRFTPGVDTPGGSAGTAALAVASGLSSPHGICVAPETGQTWVTDRADGVDLLHRVEFDGPLGEAAWNWPERPGVAGCAAWEDMVVVLLTEDSAAANLPLGPEGDFLGAPELNMVDLFGRLGPLARSGQDEMWLGTRNKEGGEPESSDDRVLVTIRPETAVGGQD
ncbi:PQQ-dependent sugar dehydrogenase [Actinoalloteichus spitiensis]|uniref:PQQ-dependent sugar dehydrogenase n=1 Tax=Actinoalloteichus spitiensis TaxID=252394 RepID=UPI0009FD7F2E|nr:PQQ-dependent sugar dehydrogenase [Actinoalloteichus spitiensis]